LDFIASAYDSGDATTSTAFCAKAEAFSDDLQFAVTKI
jgi:hypothetical protein